MAEGGEKTALIEDLLLKPFSRRTFQEKLDIVKKGQATLRLTSLSQAGKRMNLPFSVHELQVVSLAHRLRGTRLIVLLGLLVICYLSTWFLELHWVCKFDFPI